MFSIEDRVRIKQQFLYAVAGYQYKPLNHRRLVGVVKRVNGEWASVDFEQRDMPTMQDGSRPGAKTRVSAVYRRRHKYEGSGFPLCILERA